MALDEYRLTSANLAVRELLERDEDQYDVDPPYQRGSVWGAR